MTIPEDTDIEGAITAGVKAAILEIYQGRAIDQSDILHAIENGVNRAFDQLYASQIRDAIEQGTKDAFTA